MTALDRASAPAAAVEIAELDAIADLAGLSDLFDAVWGRANNPAFTVEALRALTHAGHYVVGALAGDRLVGGAVAFLARPERTGPLSLHSHILGVLPEYQAAGVGFALKQHQRTWSLERGIASVTWTFDPLVRRNGYFNVTKLGAECHAYHRDFYGGMADAINTDGSTDRCVATWRLGSPRATAAANGRLSGADVEALRERGAEVTLEVGPGTMPNIGTPDPGDVLLAQVPDDVVELRRREPAVARAWRLAVRETMGRLMGDGWAVTGMSRSGWYVLTR